MNKKNRDKRSRNGMKIISKTGLSAEINYGMGENGNTCSLIVNHPKLGKIESTIGRRLHTKKGETGIKFKYGKKDIILALDVHTRASVKRFFASLPKNEGEAANIGSTPTWMLVDKYGTTCEGLDKRVIGQIR